MRDGAKIVVTTAHSAQFGRGVIKCGMRAVLPLLLLMLLKSSRDMAGNFRSRRGVHSLPCDAGEMAVSCQALPASPSQPAVAMGVETGACDSDFRKGSVRDAGDSGSHRKSECGDRVSSSTVAE